MNNPKARLLSTKQTLALRDELAIDADDETALALSERAASKADNPPALLRWMLTHPESWNWITEEERVRARRRLGEVRRPTRPATTPSRTDRRAWTLESRYRSFEPPAASTGWQEEAELIARMHDERLRRRDMRERWGRCFGAATIVLMLVWLFW